VRQNLLLPKELFMNDASDSLNKSRSRLVEDFTTVLEDAQALLRHAAGDASKGYTDARTRLEESVKRARERIGSSQDAVLESAREAGRSADSYVREHPWESIAVGAGVGLLLGMLIARR
jgi:ElaB/YqjD/DUF883 family membrane-anchored ribosome-binding protein